MDCSRSVRKIVLYMVPLIWGFLLCDHAAARIYTFVDEAGTIHFSNVPTDARYRPASISRLRQSAESIVYQQNNAADDKIMSSHYDAFIRSAARLYEVDPLLLKAIIKTESGFNPGALSKAGAMGLMQLMPETAKDLNIADPYDPEENIYGGTKYFRKLLGLFKGDLKLALAAYNAGPTRITQSGAIPRMGETSRYVKKVLFHYDKFKETSSPRKRWVKFSY